MESDCRLVCWRSSVANGSTFHGCSVLEKDLLDLSLRMDSDDIVYTAMQVFLLATVMSLALERRRTERNSLSRGTRPRTAAPHCRESSPHWANVTATNHWHTSQLLARALVTARLSAAM